MTDPTPHPCDLRPDTDHHSHRIITDAIHTLAVARSLDPDHPAIRAHLTASLLQQTETFLSQATTDLAHHGYDRIQIAILLGLG